MTSLINAQVMASVALGLIVTGVGILMYIALDEVVEILKRGKG